MKMFFILHRFEVFVFFLLLIVTLVPRLYKINNPIADFHSWRQADTAAVSRNFVKGDFNLLRPQVDNFTPTGPQSQPNPERLFMTEFPLYNALVALFYKGFGVHEWIARLVSIIFSLGTVVFLYFLARSLFGVREAIVAALVFAIMPFSIYFSRVVMPEPAMLFYTVGMLYFVVRWVNKPSFITVLLASVFGALALLSKPFVVFVYVVPIYLLLHTYRFKFLKSGYVYLFFLISFVPLLLWRSYTSQFPYAMPSNSWLFFPENIPYTGNFFQWIFDFVRGDLRFSGAFFHWIFAIRFDRLMLTGGGVALAVAGLLRPYGKREGWFLTVWTIGLLAYVFVVPGGNVTHEYYQVPFIPLFCLLVSRGVWWFWDNARGVSAKVFTVLVIGALLVSMVAFGWFEVRKFYDIQGGVDLAGMAVDRKTPKDALVIAGDTADVTLLYNTNRHGWVTGYGSIYPNSPEKIEELRQQGASFFVTTKVSELANSEFGKYMFSHYAVFDQTRDYVIFNLQSPSGASLKSPYLAETAQFRLKTAHRLSRYFVQYRFARFTLFSSKLDNFISKETF